MRTLELPLVRRSNLTVTIQVPNSLHEIQGREIIPINEDGKPYGVFRVLTQKEGDKRFAWNPRSIPEINEAKEFFDSCVKEGLVPYKVGTKGKPTSKVMDEFDPTAGEIIFLPVANVAGG